MGIFTGSTLNLGTGGLSGAIVTPYIVNKGQIVANFTDMLTLAANIPGTGSLTKLVGNGHLDLVFLHTYSGDHGLGGLIIFAIAAEFFAPARSPQRRRPANLATGNTTDISAQPAPLVAGGALFDTNGNSRRLRLGAVGQRRPGQGRQRHADLGAASDAGGTTINGGTLAVSADNDLGSAVPGLCLRRRHAAIARELHQQRGR